MGGVNAAVNGSAHSLNTSSAHINSSRLGPGQSIKKQVQQQHVQSFADMTCDAIEDPTQMSMIKAKQQALLAQNNSNIVQNPSQIQILFNPNQAAGLHLSQVQDGEGEGDTANFINSQEHGRLMSSDTKSRKSTTQKNKSSSGQFNDMAAQTPLRPGQKKQSIATDQSNDQVFETNITSTVIGVGRKYQPPIELLNEQPRKVGKNQSNTKHGDVEDAPVVDRSYIDESVQSSME